jgi:hypothetical protein
MAHSPTAGSQPFAEQIIEGFAFDGHFHASLVGRFLEANGWIPPRTARGRKPASFPKEFLLELAAILRVAWWEHLGLKDYLPAQQQSAAEALADLYQRWSADLPQTVRAPTLPVLHTWFSRFAWSGLEEMYADVVLDDTDEHASLEALADFLWEHRHAGQTGD